MGICKRMIMMDVYEMVWGKYEMIRLVQKCVLFRACICRKNAA